VESHDHETLRVRGSKARFPNPDSKFGRRKSTAAGDDLSSQNLGLLFLQQGVVEGRRRNSATANICAVNSQYVRRCKSYRLASLLGPATHQVQFYGCALPRSDRVFRV